ncbi:MULTISPECIES: hypothetical protein [unclassified Marinobacter]|uniref:hypothetical protein n=1 Tax=unclassified Marinobacter TaxID=83889 RepID=UPI000C97647C|nr:MULTISPECIES: hypothetical protein [unclassified Marinobacter]MAB50853.1 hypothetical protein [Marinobacter sp.]
MKKPLECLVIMPVGPRSKIEYVRDTLSSFFHYFDCQGSLLLVLDDTRSEKLRDSLLNYPRTVIVNAQSLLTDGSRNHNTRGLLFVKQILALRLLSSEYEWKTLLRLDDDALIIGPNPHFDALEIFGREPDVGMLGAYLRRGDGQDKRPSLRRQGRRLLKRLISRDIIRYPAMVRTLAMLVIKAKLKGYKLGDMCTGGALFLSREAYDCIETVCGREIYNLRHSDLADDLLLALCNAAAGYKMKDFSDRDDVMAINWRGLPMPLDELVRRQKKLLHPVKDPKNQDHEKMVRRYFEKIRRESVSDANQ